MIKITEILSKPVVSILNSKTEGIIKNAIFDKNFKRLKWLVMFDNNEHLEEKTLNINNIFSCGENAVIIKDGQDLSLEASCVKIGEKYLPINNNVYTYLGKFIGKVNDIVLDDKYYIKSLIINNEEININEIITCGENVVIIQDNVKKLNIKNIKRKKKSEVNILNLKTNKEQVVNILNENNNEITENENNEPLFETEETKKVKYVLNECATLPKTFIANNELLIGRKLEKNIYSQNKELIAKKNSKITSDTINKAKMFYKLRELTKYSR